MLYKIGTKAELMMIESLFPEQVITELMTGVAVRCSEYGDDRNYLEEGGYSIVIEDADDLNDLAAIINYEAYPCEWATRIGKTGFISALYIMNDDFTVDVFMPIGIAPEAILKDLED